MMKKAFFWSGGIILILVVLTLALQVCPSCQREIGIPLTGQLPQETQPGLLSTPSAPPPAGETPAAEPTPSEQAQVVDPAAGPRMYYIPLVRNLVDKGWTMLGGNPQRTSWTAEEVDGKVRPIWYKPIEPLVPVKSQIIAGNGMLYISTARGLYALDANNGSEKWVFPTELPLGNSPTLAGGVLYVAGLDHQIYALNPNTGQKIWSYEAGAGFDTNPLVIDNLVLIGSRSGEFYAVHTTGQLAWTFKAGAPIHTSAAYANGVVYFAADDNYAYALEAASGRLVWKSTRMVGAGFHSWWPVVYQNYLILSGGNAIRHAPPLGNQKDLKKLEFECVFGNTTPPNDTLFGTRQADGWIDMTKVMQCTESFPWRRTFFILDITTGKEVTFDLDRDGKPEYAPFFWFGTYSGNRYPPVVMPDGNLYVAATYLTNNSTINRGQIVGWRFGTPYISTPAVASLANDEPFAYTAGGNHMYWNHCCDRSAGGFNNAIPNKGSLDQAREWVYLQYNINSLIPGYNEMYYHTDIDTVYGGQNGAYGLHGDQSPPIPYNGKLYMLHGNAIVAYANSSAQTVKLPRATTRATSQPVTSSVDTMKLQLAEQVRKIINAGHLRPGYAVSGNFDLPGTSSCGEWLMDYWHEPSDSIITLLRALPYLPADLQTSVKAYVAKEFTDYPPYLYYHIGYQAGASREYFNLPNEVTDSMSRWGVQIYPNSQFEGWDSSPMQFYAMWKYALQFGNARAILTNNQVRPPEAVPSNDVLARKPFVHNAFIAGYWGYLELQKLAGVAESSAIRSELNRLLALRVSTFNKDSAFGSRDCAPNTLTAECYCKAISASSNFIYLTPELGDYLHDNATSLQKVQQAVDEYNRTSPYWFVAHYEQTYGEGVIQPIYDSNAIFQARALILQQSFADVSKYLDVPIFEKGDYSYIQNLISAIEAGSR